MATIHHLNWKQLTVIKILFIIAKLMSDNDDLTKELTHLHNHISNGEFRS